MNNACLNADIKTIKTSIEYKYALNKYNIKNEITLLSKQFEAKLSILNGLKANINLVAVPNVKTGIVPIVNNINARCGIICSLGKAFLEVEPEYVWLNPEDLSSDDIIIYSNVKWIIT
jgi:hypothetical protein